MTGVAVSGQVLRGDDRAVTVSYGPGCSNKGTFSPQELNLTLRAKSLLVGFLLDNDHLWWDMLTLSGVLNRGGAMF